jgi:hypothetical protein
VLKTVWGSAFPELAMLRFLVVASREISSFAFE